MRCSCVIHNFILMAIIPVLLMTSCSSLEPIPDEVDAGAYACMQYYDPEGDPFQKNTGELVPESSLLTINKSKKALEWRQALADKAEHSLDIQYFLWQPDDTGRLLLHHVLKAADRGVRVRLLMDDFLSNNWNRQALLLNSHPKIEIKVFNPFKKIRGGMSQRAFELLTDLDRLNHRMHNKLFMADSKVAIIGGRNIGDEYFGSGTKYTYRDYDLITIGPVVEELAESFDTFWISAWTYPLEKFQGNKAGGSLEDLRRELAEKINNSELLAANYAVEPLDWSTLINASRSQIIKGRARAVFDCPPSYEDRQFPIQTAFTLNMVSMLAENEVLIISPYVVPLEQLRDQFRKSIEQGKKIMIYTNSLASIDHTYAFSGYAKHRPELLDIGIVLRELKPDSPISAQHQVPSSKSDYLSLHAKLALFDQRWVYVGSLNLDPRSAHWNTELGLLIDSPELAARILDDFSEDLDKESSWLVAMHKKTAQDKGRIYWIDENKELTNEPSRNLGQKIANWFYSLFPLDEQL